MSIRLKTLLAALVLLPVLSVASANAQTITFKKPAGAPEGIKVQVLTSNDDTTPADVDVVDDGWRYVVEPVKGVWRNEPTFLIELPPRTVEANGISSDKTVVELSFSFKATQSADEVEVPLAMFTGTRLRDRQAVADMRPFQLFEKILMAQALALHYIARLPEPDSAEARFATRVWFDTIAAAVQNLDRPLRVSPGLDQTVNKVFAPMPDSISYFRGTAEQVRARVWRDHYDLDEALAVDCDTALALLKFLEDHNVAFPGDAAIMQVTDPDQVLENMRSTISARGCTLP